MDFSSLPSDVVHRLLVALSDFQSFSAFLLTSKTLVYEVYKRHPTSILRAIAQNRTSPAYAQALRVVQLKDVSYYNGKNPFVDLPSEADVVDLPLTTALAIRLEENARAADGLLELFSLRYKDRKSVTNQLTEVETRQFLVAFYRTWFISQLIHLDVHREDSEDEDMYKNKDTDRDDDGGDGENDEDEGSEDSDSAWETRQIMRTMRAVDGVTSLLQPLSSLEIRQIYEMSTFLARVEGWVIHNRQYQTQRSLAGSDWISAINPLEAWRAYSGKSVSEAFLHNTSCKATSIFKDALSHIWSERKEFLGQYQQSLYQGILDRVENEEDKCDRCRRVTGVALIGTTNRQLWLAIRNRQNFQNFFLPGFLASVPHVSDWVNISLFYARTNPPVDAINIDDMFNEMLALANGEEGLDAAEIWSMDKWYCVECIDGVFIRHFWKWILARQRKEGEPVKSDCENGYTCQRIPYDGVHGQKYNHLCAPARRSDDILYGWKT